MLGGLRFILQQLVLSVRARRSQLLSLLLQASDHLLTLLGHLLELLNFLLVQGLDRLFSYSLLLLEHLMSLGKLRLGGLQLRVQALNNVLVLDFRRLHEL